MCNGEKGGGRGRRVVAYKEGALARFPFHMLIN